MNGTVLSEGTGAMQVHTDGQRVYVSTEFGDLTDSDVNGPYIISNDQNGRLQKRLMTIQEKEIYSGKVNQLRKSFEDMNLFNSNLVKPLENFPLQLPTIGSFPGFEIPNFFDTNVFNMG